MNNVNSFEICERSNGNVTVTFKENDKCRSIIFNKGTRAKALFLSCVLFACQRDEYSMHELSDYQIKSIVNDMREFFQFNVNSNNASVFRPEPKSIMNGIA